MKVGIEPIRHATLAVGSDHLGIYLEARIHNNDTSTVIRLGAVNIGPAHVRDVIATSTRILGRRGVLVLVEAGGQLDAILDEADVYSYRLLGGTRLRGAASTITLVGPDIHTRRSVVRRLLRRRFVGPGAGPSWNKQKVANGGRVECEGVVFGVFAAHALASQYRPLRWAATLVWATALTRTVAAKKSPWLVGGDWNSDLVHGRLGKWLLAHGWVNEHTELGALDTMHGAPIDGFGWLERMNV